MRQLLVALIVAGATLGFEVPATYAGNPSGTGPPNQSCQEIEGAGGRTPGHAASSPGSPFNEPEINSELGGTGGQHHSEKSQYDVACYHVSH